MADILSVSDYKTLRRISGSERDAQLAIASAAATDAIKQYTDRDFATAEAVEDKTYTWNGGNIVEIDDCASVSSVTVGGRILQEGVDYVLGPTMGAAQAFYWIDLFAGGLGGSPLMGFTRNEDVLAREGFPRTPRHGRYVPVVVTGAFGWEAIPASVQLAAAWIMDEAATEDAGQASGHEAEAIADLSYVNRSEEDRNAQPVLPPRVISLLEPFRRISV